MENRSSSRVTDYVNGRDLGIVAGPMATLDMVFDASLLIRAAPQ